MEILIIVVFVLGYIAIATEHNIKVDKAASALITGMLCWAIFVFSNTGIHGHELQELIENGTGHGGHGGLKNHLFDIANILFFLMGAMTIVELVDAHEGFSVITDRISTTSAVKLIWIISILTFFLSAVLDNLTTTIVMISLLRKLVKDQHMRWFFTGMVVVAANAGGAWSPIGDVTTTMLWIKGNLPDVGGMITKLLLPSFLSMAVPVAILSYSLRGKQLERPLKSEGAEHYTNPTTGFERNLVFAMGIGGLLFVPVFKTATHLPPFMGMMLSLGILWLTTEIIHRSKNSELKQELSVIGVLQKIDVASVLFFLGILSAVAALQEIGHLKALAQMLDKSIGNIYAINVVIGFLSSVVDNVPLVAAAQGMYADKMAMAMSGTEGLIDFAASGNFWLFLAYCAGVGGSTLIIGSAAGVAAMGLERIDFFWYFKKISWLAAIGYLSGALVYFLIYS
ncbi:MAG: sodium:proton antiporter [Bacteroidetes bacterium]|nr:sodium:proton antiporter [Bacteroidota bacterium]